MRKFDCNSSADISELSMDDLAQVIGGAGALEMAVGGAISVGTLGIVGNTTTPPPVATKIESVNLDTSFN